MDGGRIRAVLDHLLSLDDRAQHVGGPVELDVARYTDPARQQRELERIFRREPQLLALSCDLPGPESFLPTRLGDVPVLLTRDSGGVLRAFVNACRHRGSPVAEEGGCGKRLSCPYHGWTYDLDGRLVAVPDRTAFDGHLDGEALRPLPVAEAYGLIVASADPDATVDVDDYLGPMAPELAHLGLGTLQPVSTHTADVGLNWKLSNDAAMESYHVPYLHTTTVGPMTTQAYSYDEFGRHHRMGILGKRHTGLAVDESDPMAILEAVTLVHHLYPTTMLVVGAGIIALQRTEPGPTPSSCHLSMKTYTWGVPDERRPLSDLLWQVVLDEDCRVQSKAQQGFDSGLVDRVVFGANEPGLRNMHAAWDAAIS